MSGLSRENILSNHIQKEMTKPIFETFADATLNRVRGTYATRGTEYGDTWRNAQWLALKATRDQLGLNIPDSALRAVAAAVLVDVKYQRLEGGFKDDSIVDGIAYSALWAEEMQQQEMHKIGLCVKFEAGHAMTNGAAKATPEMGAVLAG